MDLPVGARCAVKRAIGSLAVKRVVFWAKRAAGKPCDVPARRIGRLCTLPMTIEDRTIRMAFIDRATVIRARVFEHTAPYQVHVARRAAHQCIVVGNYAILHISVCTVA